MAKYHSYRVEFKKGTRFKGSKFLGGDPWTHHCRAPNAETAKLTAARYFQKHRSEPKSLTFLMARMTARRVNM